MRNNSKASNKPLEAILRVNATRRPFEWLVHGDDDTCFALERLAAFLRKLDARAPWFLSSTCHGPAHRVPPAPCPYGCGALLGSGRLKHRGAGISRHCRRCMSPPACLHGAGAVVSLRVLGH